MIEHGLGTRIHGSPHDTLHHENGYVNCLYGQRTKVTTFLESIAGDIGETVTAQNE